MKLIIAIIKPHQLESVKNELTSVDVFRLTILDCQGFGRQKGKTEQGKSESQGGNLGMIDMRRKVQLQIAVNEKYVEPTISAIVNAGRTGDHGEIGDGKIFVLPLDECVRIRTGERGEDAI